MKERLTPVKTASELRPGMIIVVKSLFGPLRFMLLRFYGPQAMVDGTVDPVSWYVEPAPDFVRAHLPVGLGKGIARGGVVFRVEDGLEKARAKKRRKASA